MHSAGRGAAGPPGGPEIQVHHEGEVIRGRVGDFAGAIAAGGVNHPSRSSHPVDPLPEVVDREARGQVCRIASDATRVFRRQLRDFGAGTRHGYYPIAAAREGVDDGAPQSARRAHDDGEVGHAPTLPSPASGGGE